MISSIHLCFSSKAKEPEEKVHIARVINRLRSFVTGNDTISPSPFCFSTKKSQNDKNKVKLKDEI